MDLHKNVIFDENQTPIAVQIPIDEFKRMEEAIENYGLANKNTQKSEQLDMFEILEEIVPLCDAGKAFVRGEMPPARPIIINDISHPLDSRP